MIFRKKRLDNIEIHQGPKDGYFDFDKIESYYQWKKKIPCFQNINDHTWSDLDMNEVFTLLDRTHSRPGQQYLYYLLRCIPSSQRNEKIEKTIGELSKESKNTIQLIKALKRLNKRGSYFLHALFTREPMKKPKWFWLVNLLFIVTIGSLISFFIYPQIILILLLCLISNFIIHYWNKAKLMEYSNAISQLYYLYKACNHLIPFQSDRNENDKFTESQKILKSLTRKSSLLRDSSSSQSELAVLSDSIIEIIKAAFLIEPITLYRLTHEIEKHKSEIEYLFDSIGFVDSCISIAAIRASYIYSVPNFTPERILKTTQCYHPLINDPISNSVDIPENASILISGSNMSGKTTFIRTIGVNALLSQTINTVFAESWTFPKSKIFSAIRISDNLLNDESFYQKEVQVIREMIEEQREEEICLFLIDELYKGTNSIERIAAGAAVLASLHHDKSMVCASTHDLELTSMLSNYQNYHFTEQVNESEIKFDYLLHSGKLQNTNAIRILETNGYPKEITEKARKIVFELKKSKP